MNDSFGADLLALSVSALIIQLINIVFSLYLYIHSSIYNNYKQTILQKFGDSEIVTKKQNTCCSFEASIHHRILK